MGLGMFPRTTFETFEEKRKYWFMISIIIFAYNYYLTSQRVTLVCSYARESSSRRYEFESPQKEKKISGNRSFSSVMIIPKLWSKQYYV